MSHDNDNKTRLGRRQFLKLSATAMSAAAVGMTVGCGSSSSSDSAETAAPRAVLPTSTAWKFGVISDTQWTKNDDGENPASTAVDIINNVNDEFVRHGVKLVVAVGDLTDDARQNFTATHTPTGTVISYTAEDGFGIRARYTQRLYNEGIGFFPLRGNHDDSAAAATQFLRFFPQTRTGEQNNQSIQSTAYSVQNPDVQWLPEIPRTNTAAFTMGSNFSSPVSANISDMTGLSYSFDYSNVRFVLLDHFTAEDGAYNDTTPVENAVETTANPIMHQQDWISGRLSGRSANTHAFCFAHKGLLTQDHSDVMFGYTVDNILAPDFSTFAAPGLDEYITSLEENGVRYHINGHDHMHDRSLVKSLNGSEAKVMQIVTASDSSKFYTPGSDVEDTAADYGITLVNKSNDALLWGGQRQELVAQELYTVGYYIFTVDGPVVTVDFYSAPAYAEDSFSTTPTLNFSKRETFGYSLNGESYTIAQGGDLTVVDSTSTGGTNAKIINGKNGNLQQESASGRRFNIHVNTGWLDAQDSLSEIFFLNGMAYTMGSEQTDVFTLSMSYDSSKVSSAEIAGGKFGIATNDEDGTWINAVNQNFGGGNTFVQREWQSDDKLGTWGVDTASGTVWAVVNYNGYFAVVKGMA
ncbi:metallophosphoesterase [Geovibrio thiophilus]|uniref:Metallophosphoesterase n=1 Tax=Geovibrio thiophilus TaxID=139438 RepID=A0A410K079_9BACT|nr:metallophosphoesterase [Geovibrio thiophilus]QAR33846.1 metallophosphoesterase [Geovibrio thiophilus]